MRENVTTEVMREKYERQEREKIIERDEKESKSEYE